MDGAVEKDQQTSDHGRKITQKARVGSGAVLEEVSRDSHSSHLTEWDVLGCGGLENRGFAVEVFKPSRLEAVGKAEHVFSKRKAGASEGGTDEGEVGGGEGNPATSVKRTRTIRKNSGFRDDKKMVRVK
jgi:hypothetical protein